MGADIYLCIRRCYTFFPSGYINCIGNGSSMDYISRFLALMNVVIGLSGNYDVAAMLY